jgi:hypothetical protein
VLKAFPGSVMSRFGFCALVIARQCIDPFGEKIKSRSNSHCAKNIVTRHKASIMAIGKEGVGASFKLFCRKTNYE